MRRKRRHTKEKLQQFLNSHFSNSVPVNNVDRLKKTETSGKLGEWFKNSLIWMIKIRRESWQMYVIRKKRAWLCPIGCATFQNPSVKSENFVSSMKASNVSLFNGQWSTQVIFGIPAMSGGYYLDSAATRFLINIQLQNIGESTLTSLDANSFLF